MAQILSPTEENIQRAAKALSSGDVVGMPTETVYGLAGAAFNEQALARIFSKKERPTFDPLIIHVAPPNDTAPNARPKSIEFLSELGLVDLTKLSSLAQERVKLLASHFWPGPLTLVLPKQAKVPDLATSGLQTVAIRMPKHPIAQALIEAAGVPLAAPSANRFGRISPTSARDVDAELGDRLEFILDGGPCEVGLESTVLAVEPDGRLVLLRPGGTSALAIEQVTGQKPVAATAENGREKPAAPSPGMLESHYAPRKTLVLLPGEVELTSVSDKHNELKSHVPTGAKAVGLLAQRGKARQKAEKFSAILGLPTVVQVLAESGELEESARNLFSKLRLLDDSPAAVLFAEPCTSERGLGHAIADRLKRASSVKM